MRLKITINYFHIKWTITSGFEFSHYSCVTDWMLIRELLCLHLRFLFLIFTWSHFIYLTENIPRKIAFNQSSVLIAIFSMRIYCEAMCMNWFWSTLIFYPLRIINSTNRCCSLVLSCFYFIFWFDLIKKRGIFIYFVFNCFI